jgi:hypothetical protein
LAARLSHAGAHALVKKNAPCRSSTYGSGQVRAGPRPLQETVEVPVDPDDPGQGKRTETVIEDGATVFHASPDFSN